ncbi:hypothetical protein BB560_002500 [Smittium megazygosporum]|uniref:CCAAT-binding factor domain-containing protein n=1 Tax=Smittium megazygosporum TaxID=133381 RepID=A0A2T9ZEK9_9FUNG|nr:hypothetical protein BB560_002500 [Smittium megazygosporum]
MKDTNVKSPEKSRRKDVDSNIVSQDSTELKDSVKEFAKSLGLETTYPKQSSNKDLADTGKQTELLKSKKPKQAKGKKTAIAKAKASNKKDFDTNSRSKDQNTEYKNKDLQPKPFKTEKKPTKIIFDDPKPSNKKEQNLKIDQNKGKKNPTKIVFDDSGNEKHVSLESNAVSNKSQAKSKLLLDSSSRWYEVSLPDVSFTRLESESADSDALSKSEAFAMNLLEIENQTFARKRSGGDGFNATSNDMDFVSSILKSGTLSDKISALTLLSQESPIHNIDSIKTLMSMARKKHRREALLAVSSLKDLFINNILPDRKLVYYADRPWGAPNINPRYYILWIFEDFLKKTYFELIKIIEELLFDTVEYTRMSMVVHVEEMLEAKPEQEQNLLRLLVTKIGDKTKKIASKASFLILKLLNTHPYMKIIVTKTIQELFLLRQKPGNEHSQYYSMITLNQFVLTSKDSEAANTLIDVYLNAFQVVTLYDGKFGSESKPSGSEKNSKFSIVNKHSNKVYHGRNSLIKSKEKAKKENDASLKSLENKMIAAILTGLNRALPFSTLSPESWKAHADVLFKVAHSLNFNVVVQTFLFLLQLTQNGSVDSKRYYRALYDSLLDPRIETSSKQGLYLNLVFKSLQADQNTDRIMAFIRRMLQTSFYHSTPFACGILFIISEISFSKPKVRSLWKSNVPQIYSKLGVENGSTNSSENNDIDVNPVLSNKDETSDISKAHKDYDPSKREPEFSNAQNSLCWEAILLMKHYHPTLSISVLKLLSGDRLEKAANLHLHSLSHFLDRFVYRKPKQESVQRGMSIMQPNYKTDQLGTNDVIGSSSIHWSRDSVIKEELNSKLLSKKLLNRLNELAKEEKVQKDDISDDSNIKAASISAKNNRISKSFIPKYLVLSANKINPDNIFFQRFLTMKKGDKKSKDRDYDKNFDNIENDKDQLSSDIGEYEEEDGDEMISSRLDKNSLSNDKTGFGSAMFLAESDGKKKSKKNKKGAQDGEFSDDFSEDEVWKAISADLPGLEDDNMIDSDEDGSIDFDEDDYDDIKSDGEEGEEEDLESNVNEFDDEGDSDTFDGGISDEESAEIEDISDTEFDTDNFIFSDEENTKSKKRSLGKGVSEKSRSKKQKRSKKDKLPMIASFEDYAALIDK